MCYVGENREASCRSVVKFFVFTVYNVLGFSLAPLLAFLRKASYLRKKDYFVIG